MRKQGFPRSAFARDRLETKVCGYITDSLTSGKLLPGTAAKPYGCHTFLDQNMFGKVSRGSLSSIHKRQLETKASTLNHPGL